MTPDGPSIDGELLDRLQLELAEHRGADNAITTDQLGTRVGIDDSGTNPKVRDAVKVLMAERSVPVVSDHNGYYIPASREEVHEYVANLESRIDGIQQRKRLVEEAADHRLVADGGEHAPGQEPGRPPGVRW